MDEKSIEAAKRVLEDEYALFGLNDPNEIASIFSAKVAEANAFDRYALYTKLAQQHDELVSGTPKIYHRVLGIIITVAICWLIWRPLAVVMSIVAVCDFRRIAIRNAMFWSPKRALLAGAVYGVVLGLIVTFGGLLSTAGIIVRSLLSVQGAMGSLYVAYGVPNHPLMRMPGD